MDPYVKTARMPSIQSVLLLLVWVWYLSGVLAGAQPGERSRSNRFLMALIPGPARDAAGSRARQYTLRCSWAPPSLLTSIRPSLGLLWTQS